MLMTRSDAVCDTVSPDVVASLTDALQTAMEAAVFPSRFEIDEQGPLSRLEALIEQLLHFEKHKRSSPPEKEAHPTTAIIVDIAKRIRAQI
jgi:hypothetical protein